MSDNSKSDELDIHELVELAVLNVVVDFPGKVIPRIRIFFYQSDEEGVHVPYLLYEQPEEAEARSSSKFSRFRFPSKFYQAQIATLPISEMAMGVTQAATIIFNWAVSYQDRLGETLFPSPETLSSHIIQKTIAELCYSHGVFFANSRVQVHFTTEEEEYRPGIYL
ncbi:hypothetical protein H0W80_03875 [Candidatus Saccharibacteria bacterium]|nr:hypothetical protein [Candidatus Saccharibacteria bacterium]